MTTYEVYFTDVALKNLKRYPQKDQDRIMENIEQLARDPHSKSNVKKLVDFDVSYRLRVGKYRVLFEMENTLKIIDIIDILPRQSSYRRR